MKRYLGVLKEVFRLPLLILVAVDGFVGLTVLYWWLLAQTTTFVTFVSMYAGASLYFWPYVALTVGSAILFGVNLAVAVHSGFDTLCVSNNGDVLRKSPFSWRHSGLRSIGIQGGNLTGSFIGALASACPTCGAFLLSLFGVASGLAGLPLKGLELKALSFALLAGALWFSLRKLSNHEACEYCAVNDDVLRKSSSSGFNTLRVSNNGDMLRKSPLNWRRRSIPLAIAAVFLVAEIFFAIPLFQEEIAAASDAARNGSLLWQRILGRQDGNGSALYQAAVAMVLPRDGFKTKLVLGSTAQKLIEYGVIDDAKFRELYRKRGMTDADLDKLLAQPMNDPVKITGESSGVLLNVLWPLGIANKMAINETSPVNGNDLFNFASTGGWTLGKEENGGAYFNKFSIVPLTPEQEKTVLEVASNTYRPCCGNSTFFQDCNHGSALLGALELGAAQGMTSDELYRLALQLNSFWFPDTYIQTALYLKLTKNADWTSVNPKEVMGETYSSGYGWRTNVGAPFQELLKQHPDLMPEQGGGGGCGV